MLLAWLLRAADEPPASALSSLINLGAVGAVCALLLWFAWRAYKSEQERANRLEAKLLATLDAVQERVVPALSEATVALREARRDGRNPR